MADPAPPVVIVLDRPATHGTLVRWFRSLDDARNQRHVLAVTIGGVTLGYGELGGVLSLTDVPDEWIATARAAHRALKDGADVSHLATHRHRFDGGGGPLDPVEAPEG